MIMFATEYVPLDSWPIDFVQMLTDMLHVDLPNGYPVPVHMLPIEPHFSEWDELCSFSQDVSCWDTEDFRLAEKYAKRMACGDKFPPLIVSGIGGLLHDGFHRLHALRTLGVTEYPMILLDRMRDLVFSEQE